MPEDQIKSPKNKNNLEESQSKILKNLSARLTDDYFNKKNFPLRTAGQENDKVVKAEIDELIKSKAKKIAGEVNEDDDLTDINSQKTRTEFNGIGGVSEERTLLKEQLKHLERENLKLKHQLDLLKTDYESEKNHLNATIRDLKSELHRTAPLTDNKFFTFSKDLRQVVDSVKALTDEELQDVPANDSSEDHFIVNDIIRPEPTVAIESPLTNKSVLGRLDGPREVVKTETAANSENKLEHEASKHPLNPGIKKVSTKTKTVIAASTAVALVVFVAGTLLLNQKPEVNQAIVNEYLENKGQVEGVATATTNPTASPTPSLIKKEFKNAIATFEETQWEVFRDEFLGFQVEYPGNVTDLLHTGNTITFLRKEGYLFKMQRIQTTKNLDEYWQSVKESGLTYQEEAVTLGIHKALHLILDEEVEYPGNRYLLKIGDHIFDIWYATTNPAFDEDDMRRVDRMIETMRFL